MYNEADLLHEKKLSSIIFIVNTSGRKELKGNEHGKNYYKGKEDLQLNY